MKYRLFVVVVTLSVAAAVMVGHGVTRADSQSPVAENVTIASPRYDLGQAPLYVTALAPVGDQLLVATKGDRRVTLYTPDMLERVKSWDIGAVPTGIAVSGSKGYVTAQDATLRAIDIATGQISSPLKLQMGATYPVVGGGVLYVLEQFTNTVAKIDLATMQVIGRAKVLREPAQATISDDGKLLFVANHLPDQRADLDYVAADVTVVNTEDMKTVKNIKLANGSNALRGVALSNDGNYVFVSHNLGRFTVPTSQLQQGWMNTSAMSVIDARTQQYIGAVILDEPDKGAAGIWDIKCVGDKIVVSHSGTHDLSVIDYPAFIDKLKNYTGDVETLAYDLQFLYGLRTRIAIVGNGPRNIAVVKNKIVVPTYFSDTVNIVDLENQTINVVPMVENRQETAEQKGEKYFNDAQYCFQNWQSCNGCHPGDARTDGMNWDLMNDGMGNSKNCKSLLYTIQTPPSMISGIRKTGELAVRKGFTHIQFYTVSEEMAANVDAYVKSLEAIPSPYLENGQLSEKAKQGQKVFQRLACDECHSGPYYTDLKMHRIGEDIEFEEGWDTPTLREVWRTAPYLFDGRAQTMLEVFETYKHGITQKVSAKDLEALSQYVLSL